MSHQEQNSSAKARCEQSPAQAPCYRALARLDEGEGLCTRVAVLGGHRFRKQTKRHLTVMLVSWLQRPSLGS
jgi:hypothetical protein